MVESEKLARKSVLRKMGLPDIFVGGLFVLFCPSHYELLWFSQPHHAAIYGPLMCNRT